MPDPKRIKKRKTQDSSDGDTQVVKRKKKQLASFEEMQEAAKIKAALTVNLESTRSKKKKKHLKNLEDKTSRSDTKYHNDIIQYLTLWAKERTKWKFQKTKQIFIQTHVFDEKVLPPSIWSTTLKYLSGSQGRSKEELKKRSQAIISKIDALVEDGGKSSLTEESDYVRARALLQMLD